MKDLLQKYMTIINFITHCEREIVCVCVCRGVPRKGICLPVNLIEAKKEDAKYENHNTLKL